MLCRHRSLNVIYDPSVPVSENGDKKTAFVPTLGQKLQLLRYHPD